MAYEKIYWVEPNGTIRDLMDIPNLAMTLGRTGAFMPPIMASEDRIPFQYGTRTRYLTLDARDIDIPLYMSASDEDELRIKMRELLSWLNPLKGIGKIRVIRPDSTQRELFCHYSQGLQMVETQELMSPTDINFIASFRATDPLWYDVDPNTYTFGVTSGAVNFFPMLPLHLSASGFFSTPTPIGNDGDVESWPIWTITGPGSGIVITNLETSEVMDLTGLTLLSGEYVTIDSREGVRTVVKNNGMNLYSYLTPNSTIWPLYVGNNTVRVDMSGTSTDSHVVITYYQRYLSV
jgi:phage-related protein